MKLDLFKQLSLGFFTGCLLFSAALIAGNSLDLSTCNPITAYEDYIDFQEQIARYQMHDQAGTYPTDIYALNFFRRQTQLPFGYPELHQLVNKIKKGIKLDTKETQLIIGYYFCAKS